MNPRNWWILLSIIIALAIGAWLIDLRPATAPAPSTTPEIRFNVTVEIQPMPDSEPTRHENVSVAAGDTALTATDLVADIAINGEGENAFVTTINGRAANDSDREFWLLKINGADATVGAGAYQVKDNDVIRWEIDTY